MIIKIIYCFFSVLTLVFVVLGYRECNSYYELAFMAFNIVFYTYIYCSFKNIMEKKNKKRDFFILQFEKLNESIQTPILSSWRTLEDRDLFLKMKRKIDLSLKIIDDINMKYNDIDKIGEDIKFIYNIYKRYLIIAEQYTKVEDFNEKTKDMNLEITLIELRITEIMKKLYFDDN